MHIPPPQVLWYGLLQFLCRVFGLYLFRARVFGAHNFPATGGGLLATNHQSHLDPILFGLSAPRQLCFLARDTLFNFGPFGWLIRSLNAIPIDREGSGLSGLKETLRRLRDGKVVLIFPEGTRTKDGKLAPLKPGFCSVARRSKMPIIPAAVAGAYDAWPRSRALPRPGRVVIVYGKPISSDEIAAMTDPEVVEEVTRRLRECIAIGEESIALRDSNSKVTYELSTQRT